MLITTAMHWVPKNVAISVERGLDKRKGDSGGDLWIEDGSSKGLGSAKRELELSAIMLEA